MTTKFEPGVSLILTDPINFEMIVDPVITGCGHSFSRETITTWVLRTIEGTSGSPEFSLNQHFGNRTPQNSQKIIIIIPNSSCPICLAPVSKEALLPNYVLRDLLDRVKGAETPPQSLEIVARSSPDDTFEKKGTLKKEEKNNNTPLRRKMGNNIYRVACLSCMCLAVTIIMFVVALTIQFQGPGPFSYGKIDFEYTTDLSQLNPFDPSFANSSVILDGHTHTVYSDGVLQADQLLQWALASGYNAIVVSDHNTVNGALAVEEVAQENYPGQIVVIPAQEYTSCRVHMNFVNIRETIPVCDRFPCDFPTDDELQIAIQRAHAQGGFVVVNHIPWSNTFIPFLDEVRLPNHPSLATLHSWGVDAVEVVNGDVFDLPSYQYARSNGLGIITGSDIHIPRSAVAWTILNATMDPSSISATVRAGNASFLFNGTGNTQSERLLPDLPTARWQAGAPFIALANFLNAFYTFENGTPSFQGGFCQDSRVGIHGLAAALLFVYSFAAIFLFGALFLCVVVTAEYVLNCKKDQTSSSEIELDDRA